MKVTEQPTLNPTGKKTWGVTSKLVFLRQWLYNKILVTGMLNPQEFFSLDSKYLGLSRKTQTLSVFLETCYSFSLK